MNSIELVYCPILPHFQRDPGCCCWQRGQGALAALLVHLEILRELLQGITAGVSRPCRVLQPQPEPSGAKFQLESWQGWLCIPSQGQSCSLCSLGGQRGGLGSSVWGIPPTSPGHRH